jgi:hypothetical protein
MPREDAACRWIGRLREEVRARPRDADPSELRDLGIQVEGMRATVLRDARGVRAGMRTLGDALELNMRVPEVFLARGLYASIPGARARTLLLTMAASLATTRVVLSVRVDASSGRAARLVVDTPRAIADAIARRLGRPSPLPAPGDRFEAGRYAHLFPDEEPILREIASAGLEVAARESGELVLRRVPEDATAPVPPPRSAFVRDAARALRLVPEAERARHATSPERAVAAMRARGRMCHTRGALARARLRRAIGWVDALHPRGPNCYRRTLLELALDAGAAHETLVFGLDVGRTGHVAFKGREELGFDALFEIPPTCPP